MSALSASNSINHSQLALVAFFFLSFAIFLYFLKKINDKTKQLSRQNQLLLAIQELDRVILTKSVTSIDILAQEVVDLAQEKLGYFFVTIALVDSSVNGIRRVAISKTPGLENIRQILHLPINQQIVPFGTIDNLFIKAINDHKSYSSPQLFDIHRGVFSQAVSDQVQKTLRIRGVFVYPLIANNKAFGVIAYGSGKYEKDFTQFDVSIMKDFAAEVSRFLDHVLLYQNLKETSRKLAIANERLKIIDQLKDDFVSIASHELRTPMTAIRSYAWMALHKADVPLSEKLQKYLVRVLLSTERLINLVNDMLNVSRIESGRIEINPEAVDLHALIKDIIDELYFSKSQEKQIQFVVLEKQVPKAFGDPEKLRQVFLNLVGNSLKFTPNGGKIIFDFFSDGQIVEVSVSDTGVGISKEDLSRLFHKFSRLDNSYTAAATSGGTGLGLYISKNLIELMHGRIWASSEGAGKGTTFTVALPVATKDRIDHASEYAVKPKEGEAKPLEPVAVV